MIANCLAVGKTVLFVAEKTAAPDVVYRRLREHGLGPHCLELHSSKADRRSFVGQLKVSWESGTQTGDGEWIAINEKLRLRRDEINDYVAALHRRHANGLTPYLALGIALHNKDRHAPKLAWLSRDAHDEPARLALQKLADDLGLAFCSIQMRPVLQLIDASDWSAHWQDGLMEASRGLASAADMLGAAFGAFLATLGLPIRTDTTWAELGSLHRFADALVSGAGHDLGVMYDPEFQALRASLPGLAEAIDRHGTAQQSLTARYDEAALARVDINTIDQDWRQAVAAFWPNSQLGKRKVQKLLQGYVVSGTADPETDLPLLLVMQDARQEVDKHVLASKPVGFAGLATDLAAVELRLNLTQAIRQALAVPGYGADQIKPILAAIAPALRSGAADDQVRQGARRFLAAFAQLETAVHDFTVLSGNGLSLEGDTILGAIKTTMGELAGSVHLLRDWSSWCSARRKTIEHNLGPLVADIEAGLVAPADAGAAFALAYARWWLPPTLDSDPVLRAFRRFQHEHAITDFREIDDLVRAQASRRITSAIAHGLPPVQSVPRNSELGLLRHQMEL